MRTIRIALSQINTVVGDIPGNTEKIISWLNEARAQHANLVAFPELAVTGYPPEDLLLKPSFIDDNRRALEQIIPATVGLTAVVGFVDSDSDTFNAAAVIHDGSLVGVHHKHYLPNYGVFDEVRYFQPGNEWQVFQRDGVTFGANICEDIWYPGGPLHEQAIHGDAELIINISASPYHAGKGKSRERMIGTRAADHTAVVAYCNLVGGQDELVFDGQSLIVDQNGELLARGRAFEEDLVIADVEIESVFRMRLHDPRRRKEKTASESERARVERIVLVTGSDDNTEPPPHPPSIATRLHPNEEIYRALVLGTRDYVTKNRFRNVCIGLSGGIDSALTAAIAVDALGAENVTCVFMPSQFSSVESREDAERTSAYLGVRLLTLGIQEIFETSLTLLAPAFEGTPHGVAEENLQARIRGNLLMALSNKFGWLVLTTGNKSEMSVGYCTIYGDTAGGLAVIKDCPKMLVYALSRFRTSLRSADDACEKGSDGCSDALGRFLLGPPGPVIPDRILIKEPSAELRPNQKDSDSLPPYDILDGILKRYVEEDQSPQEIVAVGFDPQVVQRVIRMVDRAEYKRRQAPPGIKITPRAFGKDRRLPITNAYG